MLLWTHWKMQPKYCKEIQISLILHLEMMNLVKNSEWMQWINKEIGEMKLNPLQVEEIKWGLRASIHHKEACHLKEDLHQVKEDLQDKVDLLLKWWVGQAGQVVLIEDLLPICPWIQTKDHHLVAQVTYLEVELIPLEERNEENSINTEKQMIF